MFTAEQYRAKAGAYAKLAGTANGPDEARAFQSLERSFTELANNAQSVTENHDKMVQLAQSATRR
jgi:hypothetical protein